MERQPSQDLTFDTLCLLAELPEVEVVPQPPPEERSLGLGSSEFELLPAGNLPDLFGYLFSSADVELDHEIPARKTRVRGKPETGSACEKLGYCSSNRSCKNYEVKYYR